MNEGEVRNVCMIWICNYWREWREETSRPCPICVGGKFQAMNEGEVRNMCMIWICNYWREWKEETHKKN